MDFVNKAINQIGDVFRSMTPGARLTSALLFVAIVVSVGYLFRQQTNSAEEILFGGQAFTPDEMSELEMAFSKAGLNGWEVVNGNRLKIPRGQRNLYLAAIDTAGAAPQGFSSALDDMLSKANPFESKALTEMKARAAREKGLAKTIRSIAGIKDATVKIEEEDKGGFPPKKERRVMVAVEAIGKRSLSEDQVKAIRETVAAGTAVRADRVTVTDFNAGRAYPGRDENGGPTSDDNIYAGTKRVFERFWRDKIAEQLSVIPGVIVGVNVELDPDINNQTSTIAIDKPQSLETKTFTKESTASGGDSGARPGAVPNGVVGNTPRSVGGDSKSNATANESREEQKYVSGRTQTSIQKAPLVPKTVTVSINIPKSYYEKVWRQDNPTPAGQEPKKPDTVEIENLEKKENKKYEDIVNNLLPRTPAGEDPHPRVVVKSFLDIPVTPLEQPSVAEQAVGWLGANWSTIALIGAGMFSLMLLRGVVKGGPAPVTEPAATQSAATNSTSAGANSSEAADEASEEESDADAASRLRFQSTGRSLREELVELIREDPEAAANVLRNWIGEAA